MSNYYNNDAVAAKVYKAQSMKEIQKMGKRGGNVGGGSIYVIFGLNDVVV